MTLSYGTVLNVLIFSLQSPREQSYSPDEDQLDFEAEDSVSAANASPMFEEPTCV